MDQECQAPAYRPRDARSPIRQMAVSQKGLLPETPSRHELPSPAPNIRKSRSIAGAALQSSVAWNPALFFRGLSLYIGRSHLSGSHRDRFAPRIFIAVRPFQTMAPAGYIAPRTTGPDQSTCHTPQRMRFGRKIESLPALLPGATTRLCLTPRPAPPWRIKPLHVFRHVFAEYFRLRSDAPRRFRSAMLELTSKVYHPPWDVSSNLIFLDLTHFPHVLKRCATLCVRRS
jgi:hypothetical protein